MSVIVTGRRIMLTMIHSNPASIENGLLVIDRKFHEGMLNYVRHLGERITTVHPKGRRDFPVMDPVEIPIAGLPYHIVAVGDGSDGDSPAELAALFKSSALIYGEGFGSEAIARAADIPQIAILEYDLSTQIVVATAEVHNLPRKVSRAVKTFLRYRKAVKRWRGMTALHCNGYPIFDATGSVNPDRLLYLDSRMTADMVIPEPVLEERLSRAPGRLRLLYSGRYEPIKGALECVKAAVACARQNIDVELHCYGQGSQRQAMMDLAGREGCADRIFVHQTVPYPDLVRISRTFDVFICCHVQADPSCTYLESFGAGLPIAGYDNTMWRRLSEDSGAGFHSPMRQPARLAEVIGRLQSNRALLAEKSRLARAFAASHVFEHEFRKRTDDIRRLMRPAVA